MNNVTSATIVWKDDPDSETDVLIAEMNCVPRGYTDDDIFFYGLSRDELITAREKNTLMEGEWYVVAVEGEYTCREQNKTLKDFFNLVTPCHDDIVVRIPSESLRLWYKDRDDCLDSLCEDDWNRKVLSIEWGMTSVIFELGERV